MGSDIMSTKPTVLILYETLKMSKNKTILINTRIISQPDHQSFYIAYCLVSLHSSEISNRGHATVEGVYCQINYNAKIHILENQLLLESQWLG
jgi:hypothetical protein